MLIKCWKIMCKSNLYLKKIIHLSTEVISICLQSLQWHRGNVSYFNWSSWKCKPDIKNVLSLVFTFGFERPRQREDAPSTFAAAFPSSERSRTLSGVFLPLWFVCLIVSVCRQAAHLLQLWGQTVALVSDRKWRIRAGEEVRQRGQGEGTQEEEGTGNQEGGDIVSGDVLEEPFKQRKWFTKKKKKIHDHMMLVRNHRCRLNTAL